MNDAGVAMMAKKKSPTAKPLADERVAVVVLKGSTEYRDWLNAVSNDTLIPVAAIVRDALSKWAKGRGHAAPPEI